MSYDRVVTAALAETNSKFRLAEALALDIPPHAPGPVQPGGRAVREYLVEARQAILDAGGEPRSADTLGNYRQVAMWVRSEVGADFRWLPGVSLSAHIEAWTVGMSYDTFVEAPVKTVDAIRRASGKAGTDGPAAQIARGWSPEQKAEAAREILADPDVADEVFNTPDRREPGSATARARSNVTRAFDRSRDEDARRSEQRSASDNVGHKMSERSAQQNLAAACDAFAVAVADELRRAGPLQDSERRWLFEAAARSGAAQAAVLSYIETGRSEVDAALDDLLTGEHGG